MTRSYQTSALTGIMLDFACAQFDSHCEGLTWEFRGDHYVGLGANEDGEPPTVCTIIADANFVRMLEICRDYKLQHQLVYSPSTKWAQGGKIIESERISSLYSECGGDFDWSAGYNIEYDTFAGPSAFGKTALIATMRAFVASKAGDTIELVGAA